MAAESVEVFLSDMMEVCFDGFLLINLDFLKILWLFNRCRSGC